MCSKGLVFIFSLMVILATVLEGHEASARIRRKNFKIPKGPSTNLVEESAAIRLQKEPSVQQENPPSNLFVSMLGGFVSPQYLTVESQGHVVDYNFSGSYPLVSVQLSQFFYDYHGKWGLSESLGYSFAQFQGYTSTVLHFLPANLSAAYRGEWSSTQKIVPFAMLGPSLWSYFQRGLDQYNTSSAIWTGTLTLGASFNMNRLGFLSSRNDTEITLQYQRNFMRPTGAADFSSNVIQLGGTLDL